MIKKVQVKDLRPGMYISDFNCPWHKHPFLTNSLKVKDYYTIEKIQNAGIDEVYIDTSRGLDVTNDGTLEKLKEILKSPEDEKNRLPQPQPLYKELEVARKIREEAHQLVRHLSEEIRTGKSIKVEQVAPLVEDVFNSLTRNQDALLSLIAIKNKDAYTFEHSLNVSVLATTLAKALDLSKETVKDFSIGALLHDIGKAQIPDEILNKKSALTPAEKELMQKHPEFGLHALRDEDNINPAIIDAIYQHHEACDGSGYPRGLSCDQISLSAKITKICDIYDAMTTTRPYYNRRSSTEVLRYLFELGQKNKVDFDLVQKFIHVIGIYPVGSLVRLNTNFLAIVVESNKEKPTAPVVKIIYDLKNKTPIPARNLDLSQGIGELHRILDTEQPEKWGINLADYLMKNEVLQNT